MAYELCGKGGDLMVNANGWSSLRELARAYGWQPSGTILYRWIDHRTNQRHYPECRPKDATSKNGHWELDESWSHSYDGSAGQEITDEDAMRLCVALHRARGEILGASEIDTCQGLTELEKTWSDVWAFKLLENAIHFFGCGGCSIH